MSQDKRDTNIEEINNQYRNAGGSEAVIKWTTNNLDLLERLADDNFENKSSKEN